MDKPNKLTDSVGVPWEGRSLAENPHAHDDGSADPRLLESLMNFSAGTNEVADVIHALVNARLLVPLVANLGETGQGEHGLKVDKSAELSIVTVQAPDGQSALPVFSSVSAMSLWNPAARPVPNNTRSIALAAASEGNTRLVLDPMSATEFVLRRPAIAAIAQGLSWQPPEKNSAVIQVVEEALSIFEEVSNFELTSGDPNYRLQGQELIIQIYLKNGLEKAQLQKIETEFFVKLADNEDFVAMVDSVSVSFLAAN